MLRQVPDPFDLAQHLVMSAPIPAPIPAPNLCRCRCRCCPRRWC